MPSFHQNGPGARAVAQLVPTCTCKEPDSFSIDQERSQSWNLFGGKRARQKEVLGSVTKWRTSSLPPPGCVDLLPPSWAHGCAGPAEAQTLTWIRLGEVLCARTAAQFWKITSLCPRSSLSREVGEFHLLLDSLCLVMVRMSDIFT